ncbi:RNA signal recognition particle [Bdellovibrio bacteriovorus]|uniref:RNA signal recognition particle n=1 Tax=Bdellovibrio bacteriovorus TaxID=959 RepID=A0A150WPU3_BDEBC|nr:DUF1428 domain-containing protein [Bdellovibrio bacteriovorus]KYG66502.1 RNA signal recognition particle [Bdellovibrio bacteriovorus]
MAQYVDGFVIPVPKKNLAKYKKMAKLGRKVWMEYGALDYVECVGESIDGPWGTPFTKLCKLKSDEVLIFAYIVYKSKSARNAINKKVMSDPRMNPEHHENIFNMKRFSAGGFQVIVQAKKGKK